MSQRHDDPGDRDSDSCELCDRDIDAHGTAEFVRPDKEAVLQICPEPMQLDV
jgi:hypothetical protein